MSNSVSDVFDYIKSYYFDCNWFEVYDFIEFLANNTLSGYNYKTSGKTKNDRFVDACNEVLTREISAYRFVNKKITKITSKQEISEIVQCLKKTSKFSTVNQHFSQAFNLLTDRKNPDYRNSIKESISAIESLAKIIAKDKNGTLGQVLKKLKDEINLHPALESGFSSIYGYTSSADGIRHALMEEENLDFDDAKFFLVSCSAFINYLIAKTEVR